MHTIYSQLQCLSQNSLVKIIMWSMKIKGSQTFKSLKVLAAVKRTEIGKKAEESAGGTTNSITPLLSV